jgi:putative ABC transport system permease protein
MKHPLRKRWLRELRSEAGKYLVIFLLLVGTIGFVSGFLVADGSMMAAYNESFEKYQIENGNFRTAKKINQTQKEAIESQGVTLYDNFYVEKRLTNESTLRIFQNREKVNLVCLMQGKMPEAADEIAIDRMYADNNQIQVGDSLSDGSSEWKVTGLVALSDYSCLFADNNDSMFDSVKFGVAIVTAEAFEAFDTDMLFYSYAWRYDVQPENDASEKVMADELMDVVNGKVKLQAFVPRYLNQAIQFAGEDMGSDRAMMIAMLYIIIAIMAFVFGITISNTISKEANVIGTLRASGYTGNELIRHYMTVPLIVTAIGAVVGNLLGYTVFRNVCVAMYYGSYSLPTYVTIWNAEAFWITTIVPFILMFIINYSVLHHKMRLTPLQFLRRDIGRKKRGGALHLSKHLPFFGRFRLRVIFQNISNYIILLIGVLFANLLLLFGLMFPAVMTHYQDTIGDHLLCSYQYMLQVPVGTVNEDHKLESLLTMMYFQYAVETDNEEAEKFSAYSLKTVDDHYKSEEIILYGLVPDSQYVSVDVSEGQIYISSAYAEKYDIVPGDTITLKEAYEDTVYDFQVTGIYDYEGALNVFMSQEQLNQTFDLDKDYFCGYFSNSEITDIDEKYIGSVIDLEAMTKISRQLLVSMGSMMNLVNGFAVVIFMILIYLLSKIIIEKNAQSISMVKILGYTNSEICRLYIFATSIVVIASILISLPVEYQIMKIIFKVVMISSISGWIPLYIDPMIYIEMFFAGVLTYGVVAAMEYRKIRKIPMEEALKNLE